MSKKTVVFLNKAAILAAKDIEVEELEIPQWGGWVRIRGLDGPALGAMNAIVRDESKIGVLGAWVAAQSLVDENDKPLFTEEEVDALAKKSPKILKQVVDITLRLSGMGEKAQKEMEGNSAATSSSSTSSS